MQTRNLEFFWRILIVVWLGMLTYNTRKPPDVAVDIIVPATTIPSDKGEAKTKHTDKFIHLTKADGGEAAILPNAIESIVEWECGTTVKLAGRWGGGCCVQESKAQILKLMTEKEAQGE